MGTVVVSRMTGFAASLEDFHLATLAPPRPIRLTLEMVVTDEEEEEEEETGDKRRHHPIKARKRKCLGDPLLIVIILSLLFCCSDERHCGGPSTHPIILLARCAAVGRLCC